MIKVERLTPEHLDGFQPQQAMDIQREAMFEEFSKSDGDVWAFKHEGRVVAIGGLIPMWPGPNPGRAMAWMVMDRDSGRGMIALTRFLPHFIDAYGFARVEMWVSAGFDLGFRWAHLLGFQLETPSPMRRYLADGGDAYLFARCV